MPPYKGAPVVVVTGDAGMAYSLLELDTFVKYKLPVICIVYNNDCWGTFTMADCNAAGYAYVPVPGKSPL